MKKNYLIIVILFFSISLFAQKDYIEKNKNYSLARIYQKDYKILKVNNLELINDTVIAFKSTGSTATEELSVNEVRYVSVKKGSRALAFGLIGAGSGLLGSLLGVAQVKADPYLDDSEVNYAPIIIGITAGCGVIGAFIGAFSYKWKRLYFQNNDISSTVMIYPNIQGNSYGIGLVVTF